MSKAGAWKHRPHALVLGSTRKWVAATFRYRRLLDVCHSDSGIDMTQKRSVQKEHLSTLPFQDQNVRVQNTLLRSEFGYVGAWLVLEAFGLGA